MAQFNALQVQKNDAGEIHRAIVELDTHALPNHPVLIDVHYSSLNYKDALSATGNPGVTRAFPHVPGIDAAGVVLESSDPSVAVGDQVIAHGFDLGMNTWGGFGKRIRVPVEWVISLPDGLNLEESMILGTAGFTAALCVDKLESFGMSPDSGPIVVTGATGGVGSVGVSLLAKLGYEVVAVSGKADRAHWLKSLGAARVMSREEALAGKERALGKPIWAGVLDTVGGEILWNLLKSLKYGMSLAACGLVGGASIPASVYPFLLRHVNLLGIDSVEFPLAEKRRIWNRLGGAWKLESLESLKAPLRLDTLSNALDEILAGQMVGRGVLRHDAP